MEVHRRGLVAYIGYTHVDMPDAMNKLKKIFTMSTVKLVKYFFSPINDGQVMLSINNSFLFSSINCVVKYPLISFLSMPTLHKIFKGSMTIKIL